jgi:hypothetical protein
MFLSAIHDLLSLIYLESDWKYLCPFRLESFSELIAAPITPVANFKKLYAEVRTSKQLAPFRPPAFVNTSYLTYFMTSLGATPP